MFTSINVKISPLRFLCAAVSSVLITCGAAEAVTSVSYLQVPPSGNLAGALYDGPQAFNLPGYGSVGVTLTNPAAGPMPVTFFDQLNAYNEQTNNTLYNWGTDTQRFDMYNANPGVVETYQFNFFFLSGAPNPADLYLVVDGLATGTTATVSQAGALVGEYTFPNSIYYPAGPSSTTLYGVAGPQTFSSLGDADRLNTGWALWQPNSAVISTTGGPYPELSLSVSQIPGDGIGFTLGYATVPEPASMGLLASAGLLLGRSRRQ